MQGMQGSALEVDNTARDHELVDRVVAGDREAYADLYDAYRGRVFASCLRVCGNPEDAADATQEAFATLLRRLPELEVKNFSGYLFVVSRNAAIDTLKRKSKAVLTPNIPEVEQQEPIAAEDHPERALLLADQRRMVDIANGRLAPRQREALILHDVEGLSYEEVAREMGTTARAVAGLLRRARLTLRHAILNLSTRRLVADPRCRRAQPLLSRRMDGELEGEKREWLDNHLAVCDPCGTDLEALEEVGATFRSLAPWIAVPGLAMALGDEASAAVRSNGSNGAGRAARMWNRVRPKVSHLVAAPNRRRLLAAGVAVGLGAIAALIWVGALNDDKVAPRTGGAKVVEQNGGAGKSAGAVSATARGSGKSAEGQKAAGKSRADGSSSHSRSGSVGSTSIARGETRGSSGSSGKGGRSPSRGNGSGSGSTGSEPLTPPRGSGSGSSSSPSGGGSSGSAGSPVGGGATPGSPGSDEPPPDPGSPPVDDPPPPDPDSPPEDPPGPPPDEDPPYWP